MENCNIFNNSSLVLTKTKEDYFLTALINSVAFYKVTKTSCDGIVELVVQGSIPLEGSTITLKEDGEYLLTVTIDDKDYTLIISHYPSIINRIVTNLEFLLCKDCSDLKQLKPCITKEEQASLS